LLATAKHTNKVTAQAGKSDSKITSSFFHHPSYIEEFFRQKPLTSYIFPLTFFPNWQIIA
jgi:hypothetical protein